MATIETEHIEPETTRPPGDPEARTPETVDVPDYSLDLSAAWWYHVLRTVKGKGKAGKIFWGILTVGAATFIPGSEQLLNTIKPETTTKSMELLSDVSLWNVLGVLITVALSIFGGKFSEKVKAVVTQVRQGLKMIHEFKQKQSKGGQEITDAEKDQLIDQLQKVLESIWEIVQGKVFNTKSESK